MVRGWILSGSNPLNYEIGIDKCTVFKGSSVAYLKSKDKLNEDSFGTVMQRFNAKKYRGMRYEFSCFIKTNNLTKSVALWMQIFNEKGQLLHFDNMSNRRIQGSTNWNKYSIVLDVPDDSEMITLGVILYETGNVWLSKSSFLPVDNSVELTSNDMEEMLGYEPLNLTFDK